MNKVDTLMLCIEEYVDRAILARQDSAIELEIDRMNAAEALKQAIIEALEVDDE